jgi:hypothetical protein
MCVYFQGLGEQHDYLPLCLCTWYQEGKSPAWLSESGLRGDEASLAQFPQFSSANGLLVQREVR